MRVIRATDPTEWREHTNCKKCKSVLEVEISDLMMGGSVSARSFWWNCCICQEINYVDSARVPQEYRHFIKST